MITIDKSDKLYKYLTDLGVDNVDELYINLAKNGRYSRKDVLNYFHSTFNPSMTKEFDDIVTSTPFVAFGAAAAGMAILNIMSTDATSANAFFIYSLHGSVSKSSSSDASSSSKSSIL